MRVGVVCSGLRDVQAVDRVDYLVGVNLRRVNVGGDACGERRKWGERV